MSQLMSKDAIKRKYKIEKDKTLLDVHGPPIIHDLYSEKLIKNFFLSYENLLANNKKNEEKKVTVKEIGLDDVIDTPSKRRRAYMKMKFTIKSLSGEYKTLVEQIDTETKQHKKVIARKKIREILNALERLTAKFQEIKALKF